VLPGGKMPPSTAGETPAATLNTPQCLARCARLLRGAFGAFGTFVLCLNKARFVGLETEEPVLVEATAGLARARDAARNDAIRQRITWILVYLNSRRCNPKAHSKSSLAGKGPLIANLHNGHLFCEDSGVERSQFINQEFATLKLNGT
jgi:hypothetical protein